jgi:hypothetical protein
MLVICGATDVTHYQPVTEASFMGERWKFRE